MRFPRLEIAYNHADTGDDLHAPFGGRYDSEDVDTSDAPTHASIAAAIHSPVENLAEVYEHVFAMYRLSLAPRDEGREDGYLVTLLDDLGRQDAGTWKVARARSAAIDAYIVSVLPALNTWISAQSETDAGTTAKRRSAHHIFWDKRARLAHEADSLRNTLLSEPYDDGMKHPAETQILAIVSSQDGGSAALEYLCAQVAANRQAFAVLLRCLAHISDASCDNLKLRLASRALESDDIELREGGVRILEAYGGKQAHELLAAHVESDTWLRRYIEQVLLDTQ